MLGDFPIPWAQMLLQIHAVGLQWKGFQHPLGRDERTIRAFANAEKPMSVSFEQGLWILQMHKTMCPIAFNQLVPQIKEYLREHRGYEALRHIINSY